MNHFRFRFPAIALLLPGLAACGSVNKYKAPYDQLCVAQEDVDAGSFEHGARVCETVLADTSRAQDDFLLQRFYASYLLAQAHARASLGAPFLEDPEPLGAVAIGVGNASSGAAPERSTSPAHLVATVSHVSTALAIAGGAREKPSNVEGQELLPSELSSFGVEPATDNLKILALVAFARLHCPDNAAAILANSTALLQLESCKRHLEAARIPAGLRPWVCWSTYRYLRDRSDQPGQREAYRFALAALEDGGAAGGTIDKPMQDEFAQWLRAGAAYVFKCPRCKNELIPGRRSCVSDGEPALEFNAEPRPTAQR
jgi:hypothetical protein